MPTSLRDPAEGDETSLVAVGGYRPNRTSRICATKYIRQEDLSSGQRLFDCGKCNEVCYSSREAQLWHWKKGWHKHTCCPIEKDDPRIHHSYPDFQSARNELKREISKGTQMKGRMFLHLFQEVVRTLSISRMFDTFTEDQVSQVIVDWLVRPIEEEGPAMHSIILSLPGFTNYIFSEDIYLSNKMKDFKTKGILPNAEDEARCEALVENGDSSQLLRFSAAANIFIRGFLVSSSISNPSSPYASLVRKMDMIRWKCPWTRASDQSMMRCACTFESFQFSYDDFDRHSLESKHSGELVPGLTPKEFLGMLMADSLFIEHCSDRLGQMLTNILAEASQCDTIEPWKSFSNEDRLELLETYSEWNPPKGSLVWQHILYLITSMNPNRLWKLAGMIKDRSDNTNASLRQLGAALRATLLNNSPTKTLAYVLNTTDVLFQKWNGFRMEVPTELQILILEYAVEGDAGDNYLNSSSFMQLGRLSSTIVKNDVASVFSMMGFS